MSPDLHYGENPPDDDDFDEPDGADETQADTTTRRRPDMPKLGGYTLRGYFITNPKDEP